MFSKVESHNIHHWVITEFCRMHFIPTTRHSICIFLATEGLWNIIKPLHTNFTLGCVRISQFLMLLLCECTSRISTLAKNLGNNSLYSFTSFSIDCGLILWLMTLTAAISFISTILMDNQANVHTTMIHMPLASCAKRIIGLDCLAKMPLICSKLSSSQSSHMSSSHESKSNSAPSIDSQII